jgi:hypothetical protein
MPKKIKKKLTFIEQMNYRRENNNHIIDKLVKLDWVKPAENINSCANLFYLETYNNKNDELNNKQKVKVVYSCKNKFCANCAFLRSRKLFSDTYKVLTDIVNNEINFIAYHLTLTVKNPTIDNYTHYQTIMNKALYLMFKKTSKYKFKNYVLGYQSSRETTQDVGAKCRDELHPHIHMLLLMRSDFCYSNGEAKFTKYDILEEWNSCLKYFDPTFPTTTQGAFNKIKSKTEAEAAIYGKDVDLQNSAISEVSKYPVKISDLINMTPDHFRVLYNSLNHARLITFGGLIKQTRAKLKVKNDDVIDVFLNENQYELVKIEMFNLFKNKYQKKEMSEIDLAHHVIVANGDLNRWTLNRKFTSPELQHWLNLCDKKNYE